MNQSTTSRGRTPRSWSLPGMYPVAVLCLCLAPPCGADDRYLELIDEEVSKVDSVSVDKAVDEGQTPPAEAKASGTQSVPLRKDFEALLRREHVGTFSFYRRLPERSREEIFVDYSNGASMEALRGKIIDRYLHP